MYSVLITSNNDPYTIDCCIDPGKILEYHINIKKYYPKISCKTNSNIDMKQIITPTEINSSYIICDENILISNKIIKSQVSKYYEFKKELCTVHFISDTQKKCVLFYVVIIFNNKVNIDKQIKKILSIITDS